MALPYNSDTSVQDLRANTVMPTGQPLVSAFQGPSQGVQQMATAAQGQAMGLADAPNRAQLAGDALSLMRERTQPQFKQAQRQVGKSAAAFGRLGAGMTTTRLGDLATNRESDFALAGRELANNAAGMELQDRIGSLSALSGVQGQQHNQEMGVGAQRTNTEIAQASEQRGMRDEVRGERGRADDMAELANQRRIQQSQFEAQIQNQLYNQLISSSGAAGAIGFGGPNVLDAIPGLSGEAGRQGANASNAGAQALQNLFMKRNQNQNPVPGVQTPGSTVPASNNPWEVPVPEAM